MQGPYTLSVGGKPPFVLKRTGCQHAPHTGVWRHPGPEYRRQIVRLFCQALPQGDPPLNNHIAMFGRVATTSIMCSSSTILWCLRIEGYWNLGVLNSAAGRSVDGHERIKSSSSSSSSSSSAGRRIRAYVDPPTGRPKPSGPL